MKLSILLAGSILTSAIVGNAYAQTCGAQPSCTTLGYTYTGSTSDCLSPALKCPFNTSYFNCTKKADVAKITAPNYNSYKTLSTNGTTYTVGSGTLSGYSCGWAFFDSRNTGESHWYINNKEVGMQQGVGGNFASFNSAMFFVTSNDSFKLKGGAYQDYLRFYPCKGF